MCAVQLSSDYGFVVRRQALSEKGISTTDLLGVFECDAPMDSDSELLSFGPTFGPEAADTFIDRLKAVGLEHIDDFFLFSGDYPEWCRFEAKLDWSERD